MDSTAFVNNFLVHTKELIGTSLFTSLSVEPVSSITQHCFESGVESPMVQLSSLNVLLQLIDNMDMLGAAVISVEKRNFSIT